MICAIPPANEIVLAYALSDPHNAADESYTLLFLFSVRDVKMNWPKPVLAVVDVVLHDTLHSFVSMHSPLVIYNAPPYVVAEQLRNEESSTSIPNSSCRLCCITCMLNLHLWTSTAQTLKTCT